MLMRGKEELELVGGKLEKARLFGISATQASEASIVGP
jgi:hypothetical protein